MFRGRFLDSVGAELDVHKRANEHLDRFKAPSRGSSLSSRRFSPFPSRLVQFMSFRGFRRRNSFKGRGRSARAGRGRGTKTQSSSTTSAGVDYPTPFQSVPPECDMRIGGRLCFISDQDRVSD